MTNLKKPIVWPEIPNDGVPSSGGWPSLYRDLTRMRMQAWTRRCVQYEAAPEDFFVSWYWLHLHPIFWYYGRDKQHESALCWERGTDEGLEFRPAKVNPNSRRVSRRKVKNTKVEIWVEVFPTSLRPDSLNSIRLHDYRCDTGGDTYEEAVVDVARTIYDRHGNDRVVLTQEWDGA